MTTERITTLKRVIEEKRSALGINSDILALKGLRKFSQLDVYKYPKSVTRYIFFTKDDTRGHIGEVTYMNRKRVGEHHHIYDKMVAEIAKKVRADIEKLPDTSCETLNTYLKSLPLMDHTLEVEEDAQTLTLLKRVLDTKAKRVPQQVYKLADSRIEEVCEGAYTTFEFPIPEKSQGIFWHNTLYAGKRVKIVDLATLIALNLIVDTVQTFLKKGDQNKARLEALLQEHILFDTTRFNQLEPQTLEAALNDYGLNLPSFFRTLLIIAMEEMLRETHELQEYEARLKTLSGDYAKSFVTKKNIPKKTQEFMKQNHFLAMFGFVEADEMCDLEKLNQLSDEFVELSTQLYLPKTLNYSLRFRRLGKHKALGICFPTEETLCLDLDGVSSFTHEMFHMIDFENGILSLSPDFKPLLQRYRDCLNTAVEAEGKESGLYQAWHGTSKYAKSYFQSNEEAFARMGELYVTEVLKTKSNFSKDVYNEGMNQIVYPLDATLLAEIKTYFDQVFDRLKHQHQAVTLAKTFQAKPISTVAAFKPQPVATQPDVKKTQSFLQLSLF